MVFPEEDDDEEGGIDKRGNREEKKSRARIYREIITQHLGNRLQWNQFTQDIEIDGKLLEQPDVLIFNLSDQTNLHIDQNNGLVALKVVAQKRPYHPIRQYLDSVHGIYRGELDESIFREAITHCLGLTDLEPENLTLYSEYLKRLLIGGCDRAFRPGSKFDYVVVLQGRQGSKKSTFWKTLCGDRYFSDTVLSITSKDAMVCMARCWFVEMAEIERFTSPKYVEQFKRLISSGTDIYRPPYSKSVIVQKRQTVFVGTANRTLFLNDATGNRRIWLIPKIEAIDISWLEANRDRLWATARALHIAGEEPYLSQLLEKASELHAADHQELDPWEQTVKGYLSIREFVTSKEILTDCLQVELGRVTKADEMRVASILASAGWTRRRKTIDQLRVKGWEKTTSGPPGPPSKRSGPGVGPESKGPESFGDQHFGGGPTAPAHLAHLEQTLINKEEEGVGAGPSGYSTHGESGEVGTRGEPVGPEYMQTHIGQGFQDGPGSPTRGGPLSRGGPHQGSGATPELGQECTHPDAEGVLIYHGQSDGMALLRDQNGNLVKLCLEKLCLDGAA